MKRILIAAVFSAMVLTMYAQSYELRIVEKGQQAHVQIRSQKESLMRASENKVTDIVFGVKWLDSGIDYLSIVPGGYKMVASGGIREQGSYKFQAFGAMQTPYVIPVDWVKGKWVDIAVLQIHGAGQPQGSGYVARLALAETGYDVTTDPNVGIDLVDETPAIVGYAVTDIDNGPHASIENIGLDVAKLGPVDSRLTWVIDAPEGVRAYLVERQIGQSTWEQLAEVVSDGQYMHVYIDEDVYDGVEQKQSVSYRVKVLAASVVMSDVKTIDFSAQKLIVEVYPNPASDKVQVKMTATKTEGEAYLEMYATDGKLVYRHAILSGSVKEQIDLASANVDSGSYTVHLVSGGEILDVRALHVMR